ncbi:MAG: histidine phosphatase family protein [Burkholderiaceae bacterium]
MPRTVYLVRHTPPAVPSGTCYGAADVPLDAAGFAAQLPAIHNDLPHSALLISSPLSRCAQLAHALREQASTRTLQFDARLAEMNFGQWERKPWDDIARHEVDAWAADFWHYAGHGGESVRQLRERVLAAWEAHHNTSQPLVLITHAGPMQVIHAHVHGHDLATQKRKKIEYGEVLKIEI